MSKSVRTRTIIIVGLLLLAVYGIIGLPKNKEELLANLRTNVRLGLDLKGGSYLVLQVQVQDAIKAEADRAIETLKDELPKARIDYTSMDRNDPQSVKEADSIQINIHGVPVAKTNEFRNLIAERYPTWILTPVSSARPLYHARGQD